MFVHYLRNPRSSVAIRLKSIRSDEILLCEVVRAELIYGAYRSAKVVERLQEVDEFSSLFKSAPFDAKAAAVYGWLRSDLESIGNSIGPNDLLIASIALANDLILVTHNVREFSRVKGLRLEDWEAD